ncbi:hypothetical protein D3C71_1269170 [compost metagenome]
MAKPGKSAKCPAAGAPDHRGGLLDHDASAIPRHSSDGGVCRRGAERFVPDGDFLASVAVPRFAGAPGPGNGADAALACRVATEQSGLRRAARRISGRLGGRHGESARG